MVNDRWEVALGLTDGSGFQQAAAAAGGAGKVMRMLELELERLVMKTVGIYLKGYSPLKE